MWLSAARNNPALPDTSPFGSRSQRSVAARVHVYPFFAAGARSVSPGEVRPNTAPSPHERPTARSSVGSAVSSSHPVSGSPRQHQAVINAEDMELVDVHSSTGWWFSFMHCHCFVMIHRESNLPSPARSIILPLPHFPAMASNPKWRVLFYTMHKVFAVIIITELGLTPRQSPMHIGLYCLVHNYACSSIIAFYDSGWLLNFAIFFNKIFFVGNTHQPVTELQQLNFFF